jgi:tRNA(Ile)-lysidine synthase
MKGKKKISDFMIDKKISLYLKKSTFLLTSKDATIWIINHRADNRFKLTESTKKVLKVEVV